MAKTVKILNGYRGRATDEIYLPAGAVIEVDDKVAKQLLAAGHAAVSSGKASHGLTGPLGGGVPAAKRKAGQQEELVPAGPQTREQVLAAMKMNEVKAIAKGLDLEWPFAITKAALVTKILVAEGANPAEEPGSLEP